MLSKYAPFVNHMDARQSPEAPRIMMEMEAPKVISTTLPYRIMFKFRRSHDGHDRPCVFRFSPRATGMVRSRFVLLHETNEGLQQVAVRDTPLVRPDFGEEDVIVVSDTSIDVWELSPGGEVQTWADLDEKYHEHVVAGERYQLIWPGLEITMWDWGTKEEHKGKKLRSQAARETRLPTLILPACAGVGLTAREESVPWPDREAYLSKNGFFRANSRELQWRAAQIVRSIPPFEPSQRVPGAPVFKVVLECPPNLALSDRLSIIIRVINDAQAGTPEARPVTFSSWSIANHALQLYRRRNGKWEQHRYDDNECGHYMVVDDAPVEVNVGECSEYASLGPGESWTTEQTIHSDWSCLPTDTVVGDAFQSRYFGAEVDWWDWGDKKDHAETVIYSSGYSIPTGTNPSIKNDGRPKLIVPGSDFVQFSIVE